MNWRFRLALPSSSLLAVTALAALSACAGFTPGVPLSTAQGMSGSHSQAFAEPATSNTWTMGAPAPTRQFTGAAAAVGTNIYLVGGENHTAVLNENDVYNTLTNTWSKAKRMPTKRATLAAAAVNELVYAIGGSTFTGTPLTTVEAYNPVATPGPRRLLCRPRSTARRRRLITVSFTSLAVSLTVTVLRSTVWRLIIQRRMPGLWLHR